VDRAGWSRLSPDYERATPRLTRGQESSSAEDDGHTDEFLEGGCLSVHEHDENTLTETNWQGARVSNGDVAHELAQLKDEPGKSILVHGGAEFVQSLAARGLIDEYRLVVHPVFLGGDCRW
jgi:riboflavin biosynthesis pyrimidine reductase